MKERKKYIMALENENVPDHTLLYEMEKKKGDEILRFAIRSRMERERRGEKNAVGREGKGE